MGYEYRAIVEPPLSKEAGAQLLDALARDPRYRVTARGATWIRANFESGTSAVQEEIDEPFGGDDISLSVSPSEIYVLFNWGNLKTQVPHFMARVQEILAPLGVKVRFEDI